MNGKPSSLRTMKPIDNRKSVRDVIERCIKTGEPIPDYYRDRDPDEVIAAVQKE